MELRLDASGSNRPDAAAPIAICREFTHDPVGLALVPGAGPHPGLPGNYLHGAVFHVGADDATGSWVVHVHDSDDGAALCNVPKLPEALEKMSELIASAQFHLSELAALGFRAN